MKETYIPDGFENLDEFFNQSYQMFEQNQEELLRAFAHRSATTWQDTFRHSNKPPTSMLIRIPLKLITLAFDFGKAFLMWPNIYTYTSTNDEVIDMYSSDGVYWESRETGD
jgi:hypothetical protein